MEVVVFWDCLVSPLQIVSLFVQLVVVPCAVLPFRCPKVETHL